uniref:GOLD domain-containing protein n=1 Tax=Steinernema glaseri TaxID=37863 RepID=A0A1I8A4E4_9BILA
MHAWLAVFLAVLAVSRAEQATEKLQDEYMMTIDVPAGRTECFFQPLTHEKFIAMAINYQVIGGGNNDISFIVTNPRGDLIVNDERQPSGEHKILLDDKNQRGDYQFCFDNSFSYQSSKMLYFEVMLLDTNGDYMASYQRMFENEKLLGEQMETFTSITTKVKNNLNQIERDQANIRIVEARDRSVMEHNFENVNFYGMLYVFVMLTTFGVQVYMVRSLFEERSKVGKLLRGTGH